VRRLLFQIQLKTWSQGQAEINRQTVMLNVA
jgi:hypothetical protein